MTVTVSDHPTWPDGDPGKVLLNCIISTSVDEVFEELFGSYPQTQAKLHKQRNDTNCAESPWVAQRSQLSAQQFVWPAPPAGADAGTPAQGAYRKVRFDAAPSIASKAFSSEEIQRVLQYNPGSHYQLETEVYTKAMYGDQFTVISRYTLAARGPGKAHLHVLYAIAFKPTLSRLMKPMVAKGVDGGIRGSFSVLKKLLQEQYGLSDLPDTAPAPTIPGAPAAAAEAAPAPALAAAAQAPVPAVAAAAVAQPSLLGLADYVVYQELVASLVQVSDPQLIAKGLATCLTLGLIHLLISCLRPISQTCAAATAGSSSGWVLSWLCWPLSVGLDIPDSLGEVLGALLLVAVANKLLLLGVEVAAGALRGGSSSSVSASRAPSSMLASRAPSMLGAALSAVAAAASSSTPPAAAAANGNLAPVAEDEAAAAAAAGSTNSKADQQRQQGNRRGQSPRQQRSSPVAIPGTAANGSEGVGSEGGSGGGVEAALSNFSNAVTGWGRNLLGAGVVDSLSTNEGIKALVTGSWSKPSGDAGQGPGSTPAAGEGGARLSTAGSGPGRAPSHRHTNSFTAVMDPSGLNIIEDYAQSQQEAAQQLPQLLEENSSPATSDTGQPGLFAAAAAAGAAGVRAPSGAQTKSNGSGTEGRRKAERPLSGRSAGSSSPGRSGSPSKLVAGQRSGSPSNLQRGGSSKNALSEADAEARQPLLSALSAEGSVGQPSSQAGSNMQQQGPGQGTSRPSTPIPGDDNTVPPLLDSASPIVPQGSKSQLQTVRSSKSVTFSSSPNTPDSPSGLLSGSHSAAALLSGGSTTAKSAGGAAGPSPRNVPLARRSASPMVYGASPDGGSSAADSPRVGRLGMSGVSASYEALSASNGSSAAGYVPPVEPGQEDADEVLVEVYEHERVQPFRGWGHTWPGHFLPSDKVGHWGDRTGAPGGAVSMLFDRVAPKLPQGWTWQDDEWAVDMTGADVEGCDAEGWAYGMDFSWLTWPPAPQMGKPGLKSFVRRRRWVRMRTRLAPGDEPPAEESSQQASPVLVPQVDPLQQPLQTGSAPNSARDSDGGFMAGLSSGLGLVSHDSASAAAAAAGAMVSRFMKAVQDLPLAPRGSSGGSELGLGTSPPSIPTAAEPAGSAAAAAAAGRDTTGVAAAPRLVAPELSVSSAPAELMTTAGNPDAMRSAGTKQRQQGVMSSKSSNAGSSRQGGDSGNVSDSDSSSVISDSPPPRPQLSAALAELRKEDATGLTQPAAAAAAAAIAAAGAAAAGPAAGNVPDSVTQADATSTGAAAAPAADAVSAAPAVGSSTAAPEGATIGNGSKAQDAGLDAAAVAVAIAAGAGADAGAGTGSSSAGSAAAPADEQPQEGLPAPHTPAAPTSSVTAPATEAEVAVGTQATPSVSAAGPAEAAASAVQGDDAARQQDAPAAAAAAAAGEGTETDAVPATVTAETAVEGSPATSQPAGVQAAGTSQLSVPQKAVGEVLAPEGRPNAAASAAGGSLRLLATGKASDGASPVGSGDWVWSAAATEASGGSAPPHQQPVLEPATGSGEAGASSVAVAGHAQSHMPSGVSRSSSGGTPRGVVRTGSGARGSRGKQSKLGAVPLRRSSDGSPAGSGSGAATGGGTALGAGIAATSSSMLTVGAVPVGTSPPAAAAGSDSGLGTAALAAVSGSSNVGQAAAAARHTPSAGATNQQQEQQQQQQKKAQAQHVSGDDMGSGLAWDSSPVKQRPSAVQQAKGAPSAQQQEQEQQDARLEEAGQQGWQEW